MGWRYNVGVSHGLLWILCSRTSPGRHRSATERPELLEACFQSWTCEMVKFYVTKEGQECGTVKSQVLTLETY